MRPLRTAIIVAAFALLAKCPANAVCIYKGQLNATTTLSQEFSDSKRSKALSSQRLLGQVAHSSQ